MKIVQYPNEILTKKCPAYDMAEFDQDLVFAKAMSTILLSFKICAGLSANQFGLSKRFFIMRQGTDGVRYCFDPKITGHGKDLVLSNEGCMSLGMGMGQRVMCPRWKVIDVEYTDDRGITAAYTLKSFESRCFQHEYDHMDGKLIIRTEADE